MEGWLCDQCRSINNRRDRACYSCGSVLDLDAGADVAEVFTGVTVVRSIRDDSVSAALAGSTNGTATAESPVLEPFFQLTEAHRRTPLQRVIALWPLLALLSVVSFFVTAGMGR